MDNGTSRLRKTVILVGFFKRLSTFVTQTMKNKPIYAGNSDYIKDSHQAAAQVFPEQ